MRFWQYKLVLGFLLVSTFSVGQKTHLELIKTVKLTANFIETDNIGNIYAVNANEIKKLNFEGELLMKNSALAFGEITSLDASNALKMLLFFKDLSQASYLDNQLSTRGDRLQLDMLGYSQTTAICRSYNDGVWVYDQTTFELTRLDGQLNPSAQSGSLTQILDFVPNPNYMREYNDWVYLNDPEQGVLVFDWYGSYTKKIPVLGLKKFVIRADKLFYIKAGVLESYDLKKMAFSQIPLDGLEYIDFSLYDDKLLLITQNQLFIYRVVVN
jgi:hypothetical protein